MKVSITNFRCFRGKTTVFNFEDGKLTLLKGHSGAGKSTLLESIRWCLFGSVRGIYPSGFVPSSSNGPKTSVLIEINNLKITRSQAPEQLRVEILNMNQILSQEVAQEYIDNIFGNRNVWLSSSYIRQNERCPLMTSSNADRMTLLNEILFGSDNATGVENPDYYTEVIDAELSKTDTEITAKTAIFNSYYTKYVEAIGQFKNVYGWTEMSEEIISKFNDSIENIKNTITNLSTKLLEVSKLETRKKMLAEKLATMIFSADVLVSNIDIQKSREDLRSKEASLVECKRKLQEAVTAQTRYSGLTVELNQNKEILDKIPVINTSLSQTDLYSQITHLKSELISTQNAENSILQLTRQLEVLEKENKEVETSLGVYESRDIVYLRDILTNSEVYMLLQDLSSKMKEVCNTVDLNTFAQESDIPSFRQSYTSQKHQVTFIENICKKYNIQIKEIESVVKSSIDKLNFYEKHNAYTKLALQKDELSGKIVDVENDLTEHDIDNKIKDLEARLGSPLTCPNCKCTVEMRNNSLVLADGIVDKNEGNRQILELKRLKNTIIFNKNIQEQLHSVEARISMIDYDKNMIATLYISETEAHKLKDLVSECQRIDLASIPAYTSVELDKKLADLDKTENYYGYSDTYSYNIRLYKEDVPLKKDIDSLTTLRKNIENLPILESKLTKLTQEMEALKNKIYGLKRDLTSVQIQELLVARQLEYDLVCRYTETTKKINLVESELSKIQLMKVEEIHNQINLLEASISFIRDKIIRDEKILSDKLEYDSVKGQHDSIILDTTEANIKEMLEKNRLLQEETISQRTIAVAMLSLIRDKSELESIQQELMKISTYKTSLNSLKTLIGDVTNSALQDLVDNINNTTNSILEELFDDSLVVELKLYKEMKGKQKVKPQVNITVFYNGASYDNISILSGGESSRLSLAMTLALSVIHTSPVIFLDECMSALNADLREECVEVMKKYLLPGKTVLNVEHQAVEGIYCDCVNVDYKENK